MAAYFDIGPDRIAIKPLAFLKPVGIALILLFVLMPVMIILIAYRNNLGDIEPGNFVVALFMLPLILACIPLLIRSGRIILFDRISQSISTQTLGRKRELMRFDEAGDILLTSSFGWHYRLKSKQDRYGKGYRLSPFFQEGDKDKKEFEERLLPAIRAMLQSQPQAAPVVDYALLDTGLLQWYKEYRDGYRLNAVQNRKRFLPALIILPLILLYFWFRVATQAQPSDTERHFSLILILPLLLVLAMVTKRIYFDPQSRQIIVYRLGIAMARYRKDAFTGFTIVRKTHNGLYDGTDVRMKFRKPGSSREQELTLETFNKTTPIESFLQETEWVLRRLGS